MVFIAESGAVDWAVIYYFAAVSINSWQDRENP